jgi:hypothetical protein
MTLLPKTFFIRRPSQSRHSSPNLPSLSIYQYVQFLAKTNLESRFPKECVYAVRVGRSTKELVVSNLVSSSPLNHRTANFCSNSDIKSSTLSADQAISLGDGSILSLLCRWLDHIPYGLLELWALCMGLLCECSKSVDLLVLCRIDSSRNTSICCLVSSCRSMWRFSKP